MQSVPLVFHTEATRDRRILEKQSTSSPTRRCTRPPTALRFARASLHFGLPAAGELSRCAAALTRWKSGRQKYAQIQAYFCGRWFSALALFASRACSGSLFWCSALRVLVYEYSCGAACSACVQVRRAGTAWLSLLSRRLQLTQQQHNKALNPTAYSFARSSLRFRRRVSLVVVPVRAA